MAKKEIKIISIGGSIIIPPTGFDVRFLKKLRALILGRVKKGEKFVLVAGGGATCRQYQRAAKEARNLTERELDLLGIYATHFNAQFVRLLFGKWAHPEIIINPTRKVKTNKPIIVAGGWRPGCSTDRDAVLLAKTYGVKEIVNASNVNYIYTADPKKDPAAKPIKKMTWRQLRKMLGRKWQPGFNMPFGDPLAAKEAQKHGLRVLFIKGTMLGEFKKVLQGRNINGTIIV